MIDPPSRQTSAALTFVLYLLVMHPPVMAHLRREILNAVGPSANPTVDDLKNMKYLRAVINGQ